MIGIDDVRASIREVPAGISAPDIELAALDLAMTIGTGRGGDGTFVFVGPGDAGAREIRGRYHSFRPWTNLVDGRTGAPLVDVCILRLEPPEAAPEVAEAVSAIFTGLVELARTSPSTLAQAIEAMGSLFESGLVGTISRETEVGLAGELLTIAQSSDPSRLIEMWHSGPEDLFDFSAQGERIDVKTTTGSERTHWFSSGQVRPVPGVCTTFISIALPAVEVGATIASTFAEMTGLTEAERARVRAIVTGIAKQPPELLVNVVFDPVAARAGRLHVSAADVPAPTSAPGVGRIRWEATLDPDAVTPPTCGVSSLLGL